MKSRAPKKEQHSVAKEFLLFLSIPIGVIVILAAVLQGPNLFAKPKYDFIYDQCNDYGMCDGTYVVGESGTLQYENDANSNAGSVRPTLYYYSESQHSARQLPQSEITSYSLDSSNVSPDGYTLWQNNGSGNGFLFWGGSGDGNWYLKNGTKKKQLNLGSANTYGSQVNFIGWVRQ